MTPPEQAKVEQRHLSLIASWLKKRFGAPYAVIKPDLAWHLARFERDIRADMKREVLAEIASMLEVTHAIASPYDQPQQEKDRQTLRELKRRVDGL